MRTISPFFTWRRAMARSELPSTTKLVLFVIAEYANAVDEVMWPSVETIAGLASLSERSVGTHLTVAEQSGWLTRWKSRKHGRQWAHGHYRLSIPESAARTQLDMAEFDLAANEVVDNSELEGDSGKSGDYRKEEPFSGNAQKIGGELEGDSGNSRETGGGIEGVRKEEPFSGNAQKLGRLQEGDSGNAQKMSTETESYRNDVPTSKPVNRSTYTTSLSNTSVVSTTSGDQREKRSGEEHSLALWMLERIRQRLPDLAQPDLAEWASDLHAMIFEDGRSAQDIARLFAWADADRFWSAVVIAPARLRKNWDEIRRRRNAAIESKRAAGATQAPGAPVADDRQCSHEENGCRCARAATTIIGAGLSRRGYCRQHIGLYED